MHYVAQDSLDRFFGLSQRDGSAVLREASGVNKEQVNFERQRSEKGRGPAWEKGLGGDKHAHSEFERTRCDEASEGHRRWPRMHIAAMPRSSNEAMSSTPPQEECRSSTPPQEECRSSQRITERRSSRWNGVRRVDLAAAFRPAFDSVSGCRVELDVIKKFPCTQAEKWGDSKCPLAPNRPGWPRT
ncbi:hypothetical protein BDN72DRAFT_848039 [Pluteus cervinus]|uniref:Uncharacterized protein n=1 Tax=Pluteus cervinus TaxID=181527 RepID=A0ACD3ABX9_9AGAR|nr:hypothetical protein BDN72DRAFT_848039 [Pluteus cervinus]